MQLGGYSSKLVNFFLGLLLTCYQLFSWRKFRSERRLLFGMACQPGQQAQLPLNVVIVGYGQLVLVLRIVQD